jgi:hypothetical protein
VDLFGELEAERILHEHTHERCDVSKDLVVDGDVNDAINSNEECAP